METGVLRVIRLGEKFGSWRNLKVFSDGNFIGYANYSSITDFILESGAHNIRVSMDWYGSRETKITIPKDRAAVIKIKPADFAVVFSIFTPHTVFSIEKGGDQNI